MLPLISIVIPVRNDAARLERCLRAIDANDYPSARRRIVVIDNGSTDGSGEVARRAGAAVYQRRDRPIAAVRNEAAALASGEILAFIDADHEIDPGWLGAAADALLHGAAVVGAPYEPPEPATWVQRTYDRMRDRAFGRRAVNWLPTGNMAIWRSAFLRVKGFDPTLQTCEDVDFCRRLRAAGYAIVADPRLRSRHAGDPATLGALFTGELWRGRDNLRVSFRSPVVWRDVCSAVVPLVYLATLAAALIGAAAAHLPTLAVATSLLTALAIARALRMRAAHVRARDVPVRLAQAVVVAFTYDAARALALVFSMPHRHAGGGA